MTQPFRTAQFHPVEGDKPPTSRESEARKRACEGICKWKLVDYIVYWLTRGYVEYWGDVVYWGHVCIYIYMALRDLQTDLGLIVPGTPKSVLAMILAALRDNHEIACCCMREPIHEDFLVPLKVRTEDC